MTEPFKSKKIVLAFAVIFCLVWFYMLGARALVPTDEGRYAEMGREMAATGDWITTRLNGIKYFEKPPLQAWMNALTFKVFGLGEWQARLWTGLTGLLGIALVAHAGRRVFGARVGLMAGVVLGTSFLWSALGHVNTLDMGLAAMMTLALCGLLVAQRDEATVRERRRWMLLCWAGMALAVMSKGLIGVVLPGAVLVLYTLASRDWAIWRRLHFASGLLVFFAITVPWFLLISIRNPEFAHFFFIHEHLQRFTSNVHKREGAWYYFFPVLIVGMLPWLAVLPQSLWHGAGIANPARERIPAKFQPKKLLLIWSAFIFFFFSISGSKLPSYILPIIPALALLIAIYLEHASHKALIAAAGLVAACSAAGLAFVWKIPSMPKVAYEVPFYESYVPWAAAGALVPLIGSIVSIGLARRHRDWAFLVFAMSGFLSSQLLMRGHDALGRYSGGFVYVRAIEAELKPDTPIYSVARYEQVLPFYLRRTFTLVQNTDEMAFGLEQEPHLWIPRLDDFIAKWRSDHAAGKKSIAILRPEMYQDMRQAGVPMRVIVEDPRRVVVTNEISK
jgi:4-amino-4-deoxy-L-arabinose transferase-like glycosyltransferase